MWEVPLNPGVQDQPGKGRKSQKQTNRTHLSKDDRDSISINDLDKVQTQELLNQMRLMFLCLGNMPSLSPILIPCFCFHFSF